MNGWSEVGAGQKLGMPQLPTWSKDGATLVVRRWGRLVLRLAPHLPTRVRSEDGADQS